MNMKVTINKDLISELYPLERKDLFKEYWHLEFYRRYKKGAVRRHGFLWLKKEIVTEDVFCQWFGDKWYTKSEAIEKFAKDYGFTEGYSTTFADGTVWQKPCVYLKMSSGTVYHIYTDTYEEAEKWIEDFKKGKDNFETIEAVKEELKL